MSSQKETQMIELMPKLRNHFDPLLSQFICFCKHGVQLEGWFKGELLTALEQLEQKGGSTKFNREIRIGAKRIDIKIVIGDTTHWVELKHWLIGKQGGNKYGPAFYFGDKTTVGISKDVAALRNLSESGKRWLLILTTARPENAEWLQGIEKHNVKFNNQLIPHTNPSEFPKEYFLGLLEVV